MIIVSVRLLIGTADSDRSRSMPWAIAVTFVDDLGLNLKPGMTGATGNIL